MSDFGTGGPAEQPGDGVHGDRSRPRRLLRRLQGRPGAAHASAFYLSVLAIIGVGIVLQQMSGIFVPFVIATLLSFAFAPLVSFLGGRGAPRFVSITLVLVVFLAFGFLVVLVIYSSIQSLVREFPVYQERFAALLNDVIGRLDLPDGFVEDLELSRTIGTAVLSVSGNFMSFVSGFIVVLVFLLFLLAEKPYMRRKMNLAIQGETLQRLTRVLADVNVQIGRYVGVKLFVSLLTGAIVLVFFATVGVDFPFIWAVLTFLFNFIPSIGSIVITVLSGIFVVVQFAPDYQPIIVAISGMALTQLLIGNVLDPKLLGDSLNLSPVVILLSLLIWGYLWNVAGLFLAVPLTVAIKIVLEHIPGLAAYGVLMGTGHPDRGDDFETSEDSDE